jgi:hypothetical protein
MSDIVQWLRYGLNTFRDFRTVHSVHYDVTLVMRVFCKVIYCCTFNDILV